MKKFYLQILTFSFFSLFFSLSTTQAQTAMDFDGTNDYISVPNASDRIDNSNLSMAFWVYPTNPTPGFPNFDGIAGFRNDNSADFYILHLNTTTVEARFRNSSGTNYDIVYSGVTVNAWNHFALTYDGTTLELYHNGVSVGTQAASGFITSTTEALNIGYLPFNSPNFYLDGKLDDVCLWSRAITSTEVSEIYTACAINDNSPNLELCYLFNQGVANGTNTGITSVLDTKGNINGTFNNMALTGTSSNYTTGRGSVSTSISAAICGGGYTSPSGNYTWTTTGVYADTLMTASGCDSIIIVDLSVGSPSNSTTISPVVCGTYTSPSGNYTWTTSGAYADTLAGFAGCDSVITVNLTVNSASSSTISASECDSYTSPSGMHTWTASGTYTDVLTNAAGCDSVITVNLTINQTTTQTMEVTACGSYFSNGTTYTTSGTYNINFPNGNSAGCDSTLILNLIIDNLPDTSVTQLSDTSLMANSGGQTYQWLDCDNNYAPIAGATGQTFIATVTGNYALQISNDLCLDTSACYALVVSVHTFEPFNTEINAFPNPVDDQFFIDLGATYSDISIWITDVTGKTILTNQFDNQQMININFEKPAGVYFVEVQSGQQRAVLKLLKN